ncbi:hypothetical protein HWV62_1897 [Athelia sp. TMB]|nr:hypothetical protein HWV62_1897 [Athelia sp. TMB]
MSEKWHLGYTKITPVPGQESSFRTHLRAIKAQLFISKTIKDFDKLCPPYDQLPVEMIIENIEEHAMIYRDASWKSEALRSLYAFIVRIAISERLAVELGTDTNNLDGTAEDGEALDKLFEQTCTTITGIWAYRSPS